MLGLGNLRRALQQPACILTATLPCRHPATPLQWCQQVRGRHQYLRRRTRVKRDMLRRQAVQECELTRAVLKALHRDERLDMRWRLRAMLELHQMHSYTRPHEIKDRCVETGRGHGVLRGWRMSRIQFRENAINGRLAGVRVAEW